MKPRRRATLTSPAPCGAFLFPSSQLCNRPAQAPAFAFTGRLPSALPLSPFRPVPARQGRARRLYAPVRRCRPSAADLAPAGTPAAAPLPLPRAALCRCQPALPLSCRPAGSPCPVCRPAAGLGNPLPPACRRPRAAPEGRQPPPPPIPCRRPPPAGVKSETYETKVND